MAEAERRRRFRELFLQRLAFPFDISLTTRILAVNLVPLLVLAFSLFFLDSYRRQLLSERFALARIEAQITAEALAGATRSRQEALVVQIAKERRMRVRLYNAQGILIADSFKLAEPTFAFGDPVAAPWRQDFARGMDSVVNFLVGAPSPPDYKEPVDTEAKAWPELLLAREQGRTQIALRRAPDGSPVIIAAAPLGIRGSTLLTTRNATDITQQVRDARTSLLTIIALALALSTALSLYLARTIIEPLRRLSRATVRVRLGREREVEVPRMQERGDEIGVLARAVSDMTGALRQRIDAVEIFGADLAHEIKNPFASLRSAVESLVKVQDRDLQGQLIEIAAHDVRRIDRLVTEIAEASRIDAELSRATFVLLDLAALVENLVNAREERGLNAGRMITVELTGGVARVHGVPLRLERVVENLLDNAVSFSPPDGVVEVALAVADGRVRLSVRDHGPGIPESEREKVFARFHSLRPEDEGFGDHSGLGLAIARAIAVAHDGALRVEDTPDGGPGACLVLDLPAA